MYDQDVPPLALQDGNESQPGGHWWAPAGDGHVSVAESESTYIRPCSYCGMPADSVDHIPPRHMRAQLTAVELVAVVVEEVPACRECNSALGCRPLLTIGQRREFIKDWLTKRYAKYLRIPTWSEAELSVMGPSLQGMIRRNLAIRDMVRERIRWPR